MKNPRCTYVNDIAPFDCLKATDEVVRAGYNMTWTAWTVV
jgi:hypothetical protein